VVLPASPGLHTTDSGTYLGFLMDLGRGEFADFADFAGLSRVESRVHFNSITLHINIDHLHRSETLLACTILLSIRGTGLLSVI
jgi:hypothetical protein